VSALRVAPVPWWVCGGYALQLHVGRAWRPLGDVDVAVREIHAPRLAAYLRTVPATGVELTVSAGDDSHWVSRRAPDVRIPWGQAILTGPCATPYLAPELVLLSKSRRLAPRDLVDAAQVLPVLTGAQRAHLDELLPFGHPWRGGADGWVSS
jgi:hypothetical protein